MSANNTALKILVVDDFSTMRRIVKTLLRQNGYKNFIEADAKSTAASALDENPDIGCVIASQALQDGSGVDFLKSVRGDPKFSNLPFLLVAAEADRSQTTQSIAKIKQSAVIVKPFTGHTLGERLEKVLVKPMQKSTKKKAG